MDLGVVRPIDGVLIAHGDMIKRRWHDAERPLCDPNLGNRQIAGVSPEQGTLVAAFVLGRPDSEFAAKRDLLNDIQFVERGCCFVNL